MGGLTDYHYQTSHRYKETTTYYQNNLNIILEGIQAVQTPKIISTNTYQIETTPQYWPCNYEHWSQLHQNGLIGSRWENGTRGHANLYTNFLRTKTKNRSINLAKTTTIWMEVKGRRTHRQSLPNKSEVQTYYYRLRKQLNHHLASDPRGTHSKIISTETYQI